MLIFGSARSLDMEYISKHSSLGTVNSGVKVARELSLTLDFLYIQDPRALEESIYPILTNEVRVKNVFVANYINFDPEYYSKLQRVETSIHFVEVFQAVGFSRNPDKAVFGGYSAGIGALQIGASMTNHLCLAGFDYRYDLPKVRLGEEQSVDIHRMWYQVSAWNQLIERMVKEHRIKLCFHTASNRKMMNLALNQKLQESESFCLEE